MTDTPTPAPALTDEQALTHDVLCMGPTMSTWYAAVVARAKREVAEEIAQAIEAITFYTDGGITPGAVQAEAASLARRIGGTDA